MAERLRSRKEPNPRIFIACTLCRQKKLRCDGASPQCSRCLREHLECSYPSRRMRGPNKKSQYVKDLELQVQRLAKDVGKPRATSPNETAASSRPETSINAELPPQPPPLTSTPGDKNTSILPLQRDDGSETSQQGTSSKIALPFFHKTGESVAKSIATIRHDAFCMERFADVFSFNVNLGLVKSSFEDVQEMYPFFTIPDPNVLKALEQEAGTAAASTNWAITNSLLALTVQFKAANEHISQLLPIAWARFKSTYARLPQLITQTPCISTCQELFYMLLFLQGFADIRTSLQLSSMAATVIRVITASSDGASNFSVEELLILWGVFSLHLEVSARCGVTPSLREKDFSVPLPSRSALANSTSDFSNKTFTGTIIARAELARIQSKVADLDYSDAHLSSASIEKELESWATRRFGGVDMQNFEGSLPFQDLNLGFTYYYLSFQVTRLNKHSTEASIGFAQSAVGLLRRVPNQQYLTVWRILIYPIWASIALLEDILVKPTSPRAITNKHLVQEVYDFLENTQRIHHCDLAFTIAGLSKFNDLATDALKIEHSHDECTNPTSHAKSQDFNRIIQFLDGYKDFMSLAQGLLGNMSEPSKIRQFSGFLGIKCDATGDFGPFVPEILKPEIYNFKFGYTS